MLEWPRHFWDTTLGITVTRDAHLEITDPDGPELVQPGVEPVRIADHQDHHLIHFVRWEVLPEHGLDSVGRHTLDPVQVPREPIQGRP